MGDLRWPVIVGLGACGLVLHLFLESAQWIPAPGYVAIPAYNAAVGAVLGLIALGFLRRRSLR
jgi:tellurite resistance protein TehA-like permease